MPANDRPGDAARPASDRLPPGTRVGRVRLQVSDLERSIAYYETVIGLHARARGEGFAALAPRGAGTPLVELHARPGARPVDRRGRIGLYHVAFLLPTRADLARFVRHLSSLGVRAGMADHLVSEAVYLRDPDGLGIEVYADRPRSEWRTAGGELVMTTDPLDVDDLLAEPGADAWSGAPDGTTVGHVHLHVRDLGKAAAFYHEALGLDRTVWSYPGALFMSAGGYHHHLATNTWAAGAPVAGDADAKLLEWELVLPEEADVDAVAHRLARHAVPFHLDGQSVAASDPWGTALRVVAAAPAPDSPR